MEVVGSLAKIHTQETTFKDSISELMIRKIAAAINYILNNKTDVAPVGTIMKSILTESQFSSLRGPNWVLCDGRNVAGSAYHTLLGSVVVPDRRGTIARGLDNGRGLDPTGASMGGYEVSSIKTHTHPVAFTSVIARNSLAQLPGGNTCANGDDIVGIRGRDANAYPIIVGSALAGVGNEFVPVNGTINFFIRVN